MTKPTHAGNLRELRGYIGKIALAIALTSIPAFAQATFFIPGNLVVYVEGCGVWGTSVPANPPSNGVTGTGTCINVPGGIGTGFENSSVTGYGDNQAGPATLFQFSVNGTSSAAFVNSLVLPQNNSGANSAFSGEYGSQSEGELHLSGTGQYLTVGGYGVNAAAYDTNPSAYGNVGVPPTAGLAQTGSLQGQSYTPVPRVIALIDANGNVNTSTVVYNIFNADNPRSAYTENGTSAYFSGQGTNCDFTAGVFYLPVMGVVNTAPISITYGDTLTATYAKGGTPCNQDTRDVQIYNGALYVSLDSTAGKSNNRSYMGWFGSTLPTAPYNTGASYAGPPPANSGLTAPTSGPTMLPGLGNGGTVTAGTISGGTGKYTMTTSVVGGITYSIGNGLNAGLQINLSPESFFFANPSTLYVTDGGDGKQSSATSPIGDGGLQKWTNSKADGSGTWTLAYTLYQGLNLVLNNNASANTDGTSGLFGLAGRVVGNNVYLYATTLALGDLDPTYLYGITDNLTYTTPAQAANETFTVLATAPRNSNLRGLAWAPTIPAGGVEVTSSPSGFAFSSANTGCAPGTYTAPQTLVWTAGSSCSLSVATPQSDPAGNQYAFTGWADGVTSNPRIIAAPAPLTTYTADFALITSTSVSPASGQSGDTITLTATITPNVPFSGTLQFLVNGLGVSAPIPVAGGGVYSTSYKILLPPGSYPLSAIFTPGAGTPAALGSFGTGTLMVGANFITGFNSSAASLRNNFTGSVGARFTVGANALAASAFGRWCVAGNTGTHALQLVSESANAVVASTTVTMGGCTPGQFVYGNLASPVTLSAYTTYDLVSSETNGGDWWYSNGPVTTRPDATVTGAAYQSGAGYIASTTPNTANGPTDMIYNLPQPQPAPAFIRNYNLSGFRLRNDYTGFAGTNFLVGPTATTATSVGRACAPGNTQSHIVKFAYAATGADVPGGSAIVPMAGCSVGQFAWSALTAPLTLQAGTPYYLVSWEMSGGDLFYDQSAVTTAPVASVTSSVYSSASAWATGTAGASYGPANFQYQPPSIGPPGFLTGFAENSPSPRNNFSGFAGMGFTVGSYSLSVSTLGRACLAGNSGTHIVKLVNAATGDDVSGGSVTVPMAGCTPGQITFASLPSPVRLQAGGSYYAVSQETSGGDQFYDTGLVSTTPDAWVTGPVYWNGANYTAAASPNMAYVPPSFQYTVLPESAESLVTGVILSDAQLRNDFTGLVGTNLSVGANDLSVNALGRWCVTGNTGTHTLQLINAGTATVVPGSLATINMAGCTPGTFAYTLLVTPVTLYAGGSYFLVSGETSGADQWYNSLPLETTSAAQLTNSVYLNNGAWLYMGGPNTGYVPLNIWYTY